MKRAGPHLWLARAWEPSLVTGDDQPVNSLAKSKEKRKEKRRKKKTIIKNSEKILKSCKIISR